MPQVRAASLLGYVDLAREVGLDPYAMLRRFGIRPAVLDHLETRVPGVAVADLLEESANQSGCVSFGLRLAERRSFATVGPLGLLLRHQKSARDIWQRLTEYGRLISDVFQIRLDERDGIVTVSVNQLPEGKNRQSTEMTMGLLCRFASAAAGGQWNPISAHFTHSAPPSVDVHRRLFRCALHFDSDFDGFVFDSESLDRPNRLADEALAALARDYADRLAEVLPEPSIAEQARAGIALLLPGGNASADRVAAHLGLNKRSLQRKLAADGLSFGRLLDEMRDEISRDYLDNSSLSVAQISDLLGYATTTSFTRWFTARLGMSPSSWRAARAKPD